MARKRVNAATLKHKMEVWDFVSFENELGEIDTKKQKIKEIWCHIAPRHGGAMKPGSTDVEAIYTNQIIRCRKQSLNPKIEMFLIDRDGLKYEICDFYVDYEDSRFWEIKTKIIYK